MSQTFVANSTCKLASCEKLTLARKDWCLAELARLCAVDTAQLKPAKRSASSKSCLQNRRNASIVQGLVPKRMHGRKIMPAVPHALKRQRLQQVAVLVVTSCCTNIPRRSSYRWLGASKHRMILPSHSLSYCTTQGILPFTLHGSATVRELDVCRDGDTSGSHYSWKRSQLRTPQADGRSTCHSPQ